MEEAPQEINYRSAIIETIDFLEQLYGDLFTKLVNVAMSGEFSELKFNKGDRITFNIAYFENCDDQNVQAILALLRATQEKIDFLINVNNIQDDELGLTIEF